MKQETKDLLKKAGIEIARIIVAALAALLGLTFTSCSTTKATIVSTKDQAQTTITIKTNNPQQVDANPTINAELKKGE